MFKLVSGFKGSGASGGIIIQSKMEKFPRGQNVARQPYQGGTYPANNPPARTGFYPCLYCGKSGIGGHLMMNCPTVTHPNERMKIVRRLGRCSNCMGNHRFNECLSKKTCYCKGKHHTSLHYWFTSKILNQQGQNQQQRPQQQGGNRTQRSQNNTPRNNAPRQGQNNQNRSQNQSVGNDTGRA